MIHNLYDNNTKDTLVEVNPSSAGNSRHAHIAQLAVANLFV